MKLGIEQAEHCPDLALLRIKKEAGHLGEEGRKWLDLNDNQLRHDRERYEKITHFRNHFAKVYCTSGLGASGGWILDWGLTELAEERLLSPDNLSSVSLFPSGIIGYPILTKL